MEVLLLEHSDSGCSVRGFAPLYFWGESEVLPEEGQDGEPPLGHLLGNLRAQEGPFLCHLDCDCRTAPRPSQSLSLNLTVLPNR